MKQETTKQYTVGEDSRRFLYALDTFQQFKNTFLDALQNLYGEEQGEHLYLEHAPQFEDVERTVMEYLRVTFTQWLGGDDAQVTI